MSNFLAIATVTASLADLLRRAVREDVTGADVRTERPEDLESGLAQPVVNLYLYQVTPNAAYRNADLPTRDSEGQVVKRAQAALDLHYLLTFFGNENEWVPQRLLGSVLRTLQAHAVLTRQDIVGALAAVTGGNPDHFLTPSNLAEQPERVKFSPIVLNLEELSKLWSVFFQTAYRISIAYQASVVLIEGKEAPRAAVPVLERNVHGTDMPPVIDKILSQKGPQAEALENQPIVAGDILVLSGQGLRRDTTFVRFNTEVIPSDLFVEFNDTRIKFNLDATTLKGQLQTGRHVVQIVHSILFPPNNEPHHVLESNLAAFILRPELQSAMVGE